MKFCEYTQINIRLGLKTYQEKSPLINFSLATMCVYYGGRGQEGGSPAQGLIRGLTDGFSQGTLTKGEGSVQLISLY
jgi:hypothetical protein